MRYIRRKTNVRRHDRECRHKVADVRMHERNLKPRRILGVIPLKSLTYPQAKAVFPSLEPYGDIDEDKVINKRDCRPFDVERQDDDFDDEEKEFWKKHGITEEEVYRVAEEEYPEKLRRPHLEGTPEEQEEASENISDVLARQRQKERGLW